MSKNNSNKIRKGSLVKMADFYLAFRTEKFGIVLETDVRPPKLAKSYKIRWQGSGNTEWVYQQEIYLVKQ